MGGLKAKFTPSEQGRPQSYNSFIQNIKSIKTLVDRANASLEIIAQQSGANASDIASLQVTVGEINTIVSGLGDIDERIATQISQSKDAILIQVGELINSSSDGIHDWIGTYIRFDDYGVTVGKIGENASPIQGRFGNQRFSFQNVSGDIEYAWLDANDGLGATKVSIGDPDDANRAQRWQIMTSATGDHLRFTRHS